MSKKIVCVNLDVAIIYYLESIAKEKDRSISWLVNNYLSTAIKNDKQEIWQEAKEDIKND